MTRKRLIVFLESSLYPSKKNYNVLMYDIYTRITRIIYSSLHSALLVSGPSTVALAETNEAVDVKKVTVGTIILVCAGEQIPLDGNVVKGTAAVDESSITGEATPVSKEKDSTVFSGTVIQSGYLKVRL